MRDFKSIKGQTNMEIGKKYYLGDGENYFVYRLDKYNNETLRADLFNESGIVIAKTLVRGGMLNANKSHVDIINEFEVNALMRVTALNQEIGKINKNRIIDAEKY